MFDFDEVVDRKGTNCAKWDAIEANNKPKDVLPMWVADMDFKSPKEIENALVKRIKQGVYGYSFAPDEYFDAVISWMKRRHDFTVDKEWIVPTPGVVTAIKLCVNAYTKENDAIIMKTFIDFYAISQAEKVIQILAPEMYNTVFSYYAAILGKIPCEQYYI